MEGKHLHDEDVGDDNDDHDEYGDDEDDGDNGKHNDDIKDFLIAMIMMAMVVKLDMMMMMTNIHKEFTFTFMFFFNPKKYCFFFIQKNQYQGDIGSGEIQTPSFASVMDKDLQNQDSSIDDVNDSTKIKTTSQGNMSHKCNQCEYASSRSLVHCCTLSLCYLGAATGYRVATPYMLR